jgi:hypothetical protein
VIGVARLCFLPHLFICVRHPATILV